MIRNFLLIITLPVFILCSNLSYLCAQEKQDIKQQAGQYSIEGGEYRPQSPPQEATSERKILRPPRIEFRKEIQEERERILKPPAPVEPVLPKEELEEESKEDKIDSEEIEVAKVVVPEESNLQTGEIKDREYYIDIGDILDVSVWQVQDLSYKEVIVRPDGKISYPLIGDIKVEGLTLTKLDDIITGKLKKYVKSPEVSIMIRRFGEQANKVIVLGEIIVPGVYKFNAPPTVIEVVAAAGGYTTYAVLNSIMVIRGDMDTEPDVTRVNLAKIIKGSSLSGNIYLKPNDIVYVPRSFIGKINSFIEVFRPAFEDYQSSLNARHLHHVVRDKGGI